MQTMPDISSSFRRLGCVLQEEIDLLTTRSFDALPGIIERKARILLEITRLSRNAQKEHSEVLSIEVRRVVDLLEVNQRMLSSHLRAATSISQVIRATISDQSWDGTYTASCAGEK